MFNNIGVILRFPIFIAIVAAKLLVQLPLEIILVKFILGTILLIVSTMQIIMAIIFSRKKEFEQGVDSIRDVLGLMFDFEALDFKDTTYFLKNGHYPSR